MVAKAKAKRVRKVRTESISVELPVVEVFFKNKFKEARAREIVRLGGANTTFSGNNSDQNAYRVAKATGKEGEELVLEVYKVLGGTI